MAWTRGQLLLLLILATSCAFVRTTQLKNTCKKNNQNISSDHNINLLKLLKELMIESESPGLPDVECCPGFKGPIDNCQPICPEDCGVNSFCRTPEKCDCLDGYRLDADGVCVPKCSGCGPNAYCKWPEVCMCLQDHEHVDAGGCQLRPNLHLCRQPETQSTDNVTSLTNGTIEVCCEGYERQNDTEPCLPKLKAHECTKPFQVPITIDGVWEWTVWSIKTNNLNLIRPRTQTEILRVCCDGYERLNEESPCLPKDSIENISGWSQLRKEFEKLKIPFPEDLFKKMNCKENKEEEINTTEAPIEDPNLCAIEISDSDEKEEAIRKEFEKLGNTFYPANFPKPNQIRKVCCEGYTRESEEQLCQPVSEPKCDEGYTMDANDLCQPKCEDSLPEHSSCVRPGEWECDEGYIKLRTEDGQGYSCQPHCQQSCSIYGQCVAPNVCQCLPGYRSDLVALGPNRFVKDCVSKEKADNQIDEYAQIQFRSSA